MLHRPQVTHPRSVSSKIVGQLSVKIILAARSPPNIKESPARFIPAPKPINLSAQAIDIDKPIRGAFVRREVVGKNLTR